MEIKRDLEGYIGVVFQDPSNTGSGLFNANSHRLTTTGFQWRLGAICPGGVDLIFVFAYDDSKGRREKRFQIWMVYTITPRSC